MNSSNYQKELDKLLAQLADRARQPDVSAPSGVSAAPTLLLHSCCAPCSSYVLRYLKEYFRITVFYYNPNISEKEEYERRIREQKRLIAAYNEEGAGYSIGVVEGSYEPQVFFETVRGFEECPEGGERCFLCYQLRLLKTYREAVRQGADYYGTTLTVSPLKNARKLNEIGESLSAGKSGPKWLFSDFKKKDGYKQSVSLSREYGLYRQDFCGCSFSRAEREKQKAERPAKNLGE